MSDSQPDDLFEIESLDTLKVVADPLRTQILEQLVVRSQTVKEVAAHLGLTPGRLYYHVNLLEEHGLIRVVAQRMISNLVEKVYRASAYQYDVKSSLLNFDTQEGKASINTIVLGVLHATQEDLKRSLEARAYALELGAPERPRQTTVTRQVYRIPETRATEFQERLRGIMADFEAARVDDDWDDAEAHAYAMTVAFYPSFDYPDETGDPGVSPGPDESAPAARDADPP